MTSQKTFRSARLLSQTLVKPGSAIWNAHKPRSEASAYHRFAECNPEAARLIHDLNHSLTMPIAFSGYVMNRDSSLAVEASAVMQSLKTATSMLDALMEVSVHDERLVAGMVRDILGDIRSIVAYSLSFVIGTVLRDDLTERANRMAMMAARNLIKSQGLLRQLVDSSPTPKPKGPVHVPPLLQSAIEMAASGAFASGEHEKYTFKLSIEGTLPTVHGDSDALERVFTNLVINAVHAMPEGGSVRAKARLHGESILVTISDSGIGMDDKVMAKLFQPFFTTKGENGTGLGLAIVNDVVRAHGGKVSVQSKPGEGTTFQIILPSKR